MGSTFIYTTLCFIALIIVSFVVVASAEEFKVGDAVGWREPSVNETDIYNRWASNKKFHIGDSLRFEYRNDSVIKVGKWEFYHCNRSHPASAGKDGTRKVNLNRAGLFYFVSGDPEHCQNGQRLAVEVLPLHPISESPPQPFSQAPAPLSSSAAVYSSVPLAFISALLISVIVVAIAGLA